MNRVIKIGKELAPVSEEVYQAYYKMARRERYMERDIKVGRIDVDFIKEVVTFVPSKEDSAERLMDEGVDFADETLVEEAICDKVTLLILQEAMTELDCEERDLIHAIYYEQLTTREISQQRNVPKTTIIRRHKKIIEKLRRYF